jgi:hypothetical protein
MWTFFSYFMDAVCVRACVRVVDTAACYVNFLSSLLHFTVDRTLMQWPLSVRYGLVRYYGSCPPYCCVCVTVSAEFSSRPRTDRLHSTRMAECSNFVASFLIPNRAKWNWRPSSRAFLMYLCIRAHVDEVSKLSYFFLGGGVDISNSVQVSEELKPFVCIWVTHDILSTCIKSILAEGLHEFLQALDANFGT